MKPTLFFPVFLVANILFFGGAGLYGQVSSPIVGFVKVSTSPDADIMATAPFYATPEFVGVLSAAPDTSGATAVLEVGGDPGWGADTFSSHYVQIGSGTSEGVWFLVTGNAAATLTVELRGLGGSVPLAADDQILVIPNRTLDDIFPPADQPDGQKAAGDLPPQRKMEVLLYENGTGTDRAPNRVFFLTTTGWKESKRTFPVAGGEVIPPDAVFVVRSGPDTETPYVLLHGTVSESVHSIALKTRTDGEQDTVVSLRRPVPVKVGELGLEVGFVESASTAAGDREDQLLIRDNLVSTLKNRGVSAIYFRVGGTWIKDAAGFSAGGDDEIPPDAVIIVRKAPTNDGAPVLWRNTPSWVAQAP